MKKSLLILTLAIFLIFGTTIYAQEEVLINSNETILSEEELTDPGLLPDHPLYFLKSLSENVGTFFTFGEINRANRQMMLAEKRLAEAQALMAQGETELAEKIMNRYQKRFAHALAFAQRAQEAGQNTNKVMAKIAENTLRHQAVLSRVYDQVPKEAKAAIQSAMENSLRGHRQALEAISQEETEEEVGKILERIEKRRPAIEERINQLQEQGVPIPTLSPRGQEQGGTNQNLNEINQINQENTIREAQTGNNQTEGQDIPIQGQEQAQEQIQERTPIAEQQ